MTELHDDGWQIIIATSRKDDNRGETLRWLRLNRIPHDGVYFGDKTILTPDVLIDDKPETLEAMQANPDVRLFHLDHAYCRRAFGQSFHHWAAIPLLLGATR